MSAAFVLAEAVGFVVAVLTAIVVAGMLPAAAAMERLPPTGLSNSLCALSCALAMTR